MVCLGLGHLPETPAVQGEAQGVDGESGFGGAGEHGGSELIAAAGLEGKCRTSRGGGQRTHVPRGCMV